MLLRGCIQWAQIPNLSEVPSSLNAPVLLQLAFKFVPTREQFVASLDTSEQDNLEQQVQDFVDAFGPLLQEIHKYMVRLLNPSHLILELTSQLVLLLTIFLHRSPSCPLFRRLTTILMIRPKYDEEGIIVGRAQSHAERGGYIKGSLLGELIDTQREGEIYI